MNASVIRSGCLKRRSISSVPARASRGRRRGHSTPKFD